MSGNPQRLSELDISYLVKHTNVSKDEIALLHDELVGDQPDGKMDKPQFRKWFTKMGIKVKGKPNADINLVEDHIFRRFDRNGEGVITLQEYMTIMYMMTDGTKDEKAENLFCLFDVDGDGELTREEMGAVWNKIFKSKEEFEKIFDEMDVNKDGTVSKEEFIKFFPKVSQQGAWITSL